jgi:hypothetical protein
MSLQIKAPHWTESLTKLAARRTGRRITLVLKGFELSLQVTPFDEDYRVTFAGQLRMQLKHRGSGEIVEVLPEGVSLEFRGPALRFYLPHAGAQPIVTAVVRGRLLSNLTTGPKGDFVYRGQWHIADGTLFLGEYWVQFRDGSEYIKSPVVTLEAPGNQ